MSVDFDVIVLGAGGAGLAAAVTAAQAGGRVLVAEAADRVGGSSVMSTGVLYAAGTAVQKARGVEDDPEAMFNYIMTLNAYNAQPALMRAFCQGSGPAVEWLTSLGVTFRPEDLYMAGVDMVPRGHRANGNGLEIIGALDNAAGAAGVTYALKTRVRRLLRGPDGAVAGIEADGEAVRAHAVVVATGGFGANRELLARYYPTAARSESLWYMGSDHCRGDGLQMGLDIGAELGGFDNGLITCTPALARESGAYLPGWVVYVNRDGRRFVRETAAYAVMAHVVEAQLGAEAFVIFDEASRAAARQIVTYKPIAPSWTADQLARFIAAGVITQADTLDALAEKVGIRPATLATTVETYNADCDRGEDTQFFKDPAWLRKIATPPFYARRLRPGVLAETAVGLRIDTSARVLDAADRPIPGLYAAGETTAVLPHKYPAGGASLTNNTVFGKIAGKEAARKAGVNGLV